MKKPTIFQRIKLWYLRDKAKDLRRLADCARREEVLLQVQAKACQIAERQYRNKLRLVESQLIAFEAEVGVS